MKIVLTGGGSGGHITPLLAVAHELKTILPEAQLIYVGQKGDKLGDIPKEHADIDEAFAVRAGKFRRYSGVGLRQIFFITTVLKNIRDVGRVLLGFFESRQLLKKIKPDVIFIKGGFVGVPVGLAASRLGIPYVTHDSDAIPGLANRIIAKGAAAHAVALPKETYPYPVEKTYTVGVPIHSEFQPVNAERVGEYKAQLGLDKFEQVIFVTGGGNGARKLNLAVIAVAAGLFKEFPQAAIVHVAGRNHEKQVGEAYSKVLDSEISRVFVKGFVDNLYQYSGAADVIIARGSATNLAEFAVQKKACIIVPAKQLIWTVKNAEALSEKEAAIVLDEDSIEAEPQKLLEACEQLLKDPERRETLGKNLAATLAHPYAARELAELLVKFGKK